jgi:hypothetical protein
MTSEDDPQSPMSPQRTSSDNIQDLTDRFKYKVRYVYQFFSSIQPHSFSICYIHEQNLTF